MSGSIQIHGASACLALGRGIRATVPLTVPFVPTDLAGLQVWLDGTDSSTMYDATTGGSLVALNGAVARWEDKSGNARHATQSTANNRPLRKASYLEFDGTDDGLLFTYSPTAFVGVIFAVFQRLSIQYGYRSVTAFGTGADGSMLLSQITSGKWGSFTDVEVSANTTSATLALGCYTIVDNAGSGGAFYLNGAADGTYTGNIIGQSYSGISGQSGQETNMNLHELVIYNTTLTSGERAQVEAYLMAKHGL